MSAPRARLVAQAAVEVLGNRGSQGLTHRAVDRQAGLPEGSTSNLFRTRAALISAVCLYLTERDLGQLRQAAAGLATGRGMTTEQAASDLADIVQHWAGEDALYTCARLELFLAARRDKEVAGNLARARASFRDFVANWLEDLCPGGGVHVAGLMALVEGLTLSQLLHPETRLSPAAMRAEIAMFLQAITA